MQNSVKYFNIHDNFCIYNNLFYLSFLFFTSKDNFVTIWTVFRINNVKYL